MECNIKKENCKEDYYKAYEERYVTVHEKGMLWQSDERTIEIENTINKYSITKESAILEIGCGEGRDAIYLLDNGYNLLATDYSSAAIKKCNELTNNKYLDSFKTFDLFEDELDKKFDFIYSVCVLHMFVLKEHRNKFYKFIRKHLSTNGIAFVAVLGNGNNEFASNIENAYKMEERIVQNNNTSVIVPSTSCKIVNKITFLNEIIDNGFEVLENYVAKDIPEFSECLCAVIKVNKRL